MKCGNKIPCPCPQSSQTFRVYSQQVTQPLNVSPCLSCSPYLYCTSHPACAIPCHSQYLHHPPHPPHLHCLPCSTHLCHPPCPTHLHCPLLTMMATHLLTLLALPISLNLIALPAPLTCLPCFHCFVD